MALNFREICRLCLGKKESLAPLFREQLPDAVTSLPAKIMSFVPVLKVCCFSFKRSLFIVKYMLCLVKGYVFCNILNRNSSHLENVWVVLIFYPVFHGMYYNVRFYMF